jgi:aryl-alcohol dehydrogenase-like predicted oxidoreductase
LTPQYNIPRHRVTLLTKCNHLVADEVETLTPVRPELRNERNYVNQSGLSRAAIFNQVEASLKRLETDYIDLLQIHRADMDHVPAEASNYSALPSAPGHLHGIYAQETMKALNDLVQMGKVRYIGASSMWTWQFQHYNNVAEVSHRLLKSSCFVYLLMTPCRKTAGQPSSPCKTSIHSCTPSQRHIFFLSLLTTCQVS